MAGGCSTGRALVSLSSSSNISLSRSLLLFSSSAAAAKPRRLWRLSVPPFPRPFSAAASTTVEVEQDMKPLRHSMLLERIRARHLKDASNSAVHPATASTAVDKRKGKTNEEMEVEKVGFGDLGLDEEVIGAVTEMAISVPTEIQRIGIPAVLNGKSVVLGSHTGSGKTLAYMLPIVQLLRHDEAVNGRSMKPRRPRAVVLCPTRELSEQVFHVAKSISHHARFRSTMISGGGRLRPQEDSLNVPIDMVVGTPGRILQHVEEGNMVYGDIKYLILDEADTMFDRGFGPDIRKFLSPLKNRASKPGDPGFQTVLVTATMTQAVQRLVDEEFFGITHLRTSSLHKKVASARHDFIKLSGSENKMEALLQVLEPSLAKGNRVMVFCNTLNSSRAVDHFLSENQIFTVNYHGEVPAEQRTQNLKKFKNEDGDCPTLVCTDLAARGLDLDVDHVVMFDFPLNSIDYLHRTGRTARMGAKGKVTSLVTRKDLQLATRIEEAMRKNESLESLNSDKVTVKPRQGVPKVKTSSIVKVADKKKKTGAPSQSLSKSQRKTDQGRSSTTPRPKKGITLSRRPKVSSGTGGTGMSKQTQKKRDIGRKRASPGSGVPKLNVVGFRGRSSLNKTAS